MDASGIIGNLHDLLPAIRRHAPEIERARRLPAHLVTALQGSGVFRLTLPRDLGGVEAEPSDLLRAIELVSTADGSVGWCTMVGLGNNIVAGYMPVDGAREVFANPDAPTAGIAAPAGRAVPVDGGVRVTGRWPFASGITHAEWAWAGCLLMDGDHPRMSPTGPVIVHACIPVADVTVHDTWQVSGLRGTGSHDFSIEDAFVPERRLFTLLDSSEHRLVPLYQMPPLGLFVYQLAAVSLGLARRALDDLIDLAQKKVPTLYNSPLADRPAVHLGLSHAEAALGSARAFLHEAVVEIWRAVSAGRSLTARQVALGRLAATAAVEAGASVTRTAATLAGGGALYDESPMQRHVRDAEAATHHFTVAPHTWEEAGRVLLGRPTVAPIF